ncbi:Histidine kinase-like ATPase domain-containing protein [Micromonospora rhizosphaerae]|uniref:Histidine kinase-like ATPase domain-containing protein n=1 Tax=Micromonospora rhizosphaerae TaxID=568872 RepID=A0A1C6TD31_9ACTN|nr:ATP-binding protein [Micromonospora rhizosphaerae]SCL39681.1 Histidine kinase-like ATPase domain-containing protein [Micromonospora rhizosphaerae]
MNRTERSDARPEAGMHNGTIMPTDVRCLVETDESSAMVRLTGVLDLAGVGAVRDALLARLWARPGPVIADLSRLRVAEPAARAVFDEVHREVSDWPASDLLVLDPAGAWEATGTPVCASLDEAQAALVAAPLAAVLNAELTPAVGAAREARALITDGCTRWEVPELAEPACIAVTEMVNNVVAHAQTPMTVRVAPGDSSLHLAVRDRSPRQPAFAGLAPLTSAGGRGLLLIDTVSRRWGSTPVPDGKVVWCVLDPEDEAAFRG